MKRLTLIIAVVFSSDSVFAAKQVETIRGRTVFRPLTSLTPRHVPTGVRVVSLDDLKIEFSAQQVCGYTDWTTAVVSMPGQILSGAYWAKVGRRAKQQAINAVLAISGALPTMLACNASPTFCHVLNRAEALAQANLKFTFDSCQILDRREDPTNSHYESLKGCVSSHTKNGVQPSVGLDRCSVGDKDPSELTADDRRKNAEKDAGDPYKSALLDEGLCKESTYSRFRASSHAYTVSERSCRWFKKYFPGMSIEATGRLRHGGTFSNSPGEELYSKKSGEVTSFLLKLLDEMHDLRYGIGAYEDTGPLPTHEVIRHAKIKEMLSLGDGMQIKGACPGKGECKVDIKPSPLHRSISADAVPTLMVHPSALVEIIERLPKTARPSKQYKDGDSQLAFVLEPLVQSVAFATSQDIVSEAKNQLVSRCQEPDMQSTAAQDDCARRLARLDRTKENLNARADTERRHVEAQALFYAQLNKLQTHTRLSDRPTMQGPDQIAWPRKEEKAS